MVRTVVTYVYRRHGAAPEILLLRRLAERGRGRWVPAGGVVEAGETSEVAAVREVREETGLDVAATLVALGCTYGFERGDRVFEEEAFAALAPHLWEPTLEPREHDRYAWFSLGDARRRIAWPENRIALDVLEKLL